MAAYARALLSVIAISITLEVLWTGGISRPPTVLYHLWHIGLMLFVLAVRLAYQRQLSPEVAKYSLVLIVGMAFATVGDVVNSAISGIEPISRKCRPR
ncbi:hypothetical protein [Mycobacterium ulcerans]|uniref:hypothetical protein n=1 Tax=Mycobacterium ulcerans TaxID=1809 RepID=UPI001FFD0FD8|nr:hypothetical protein [Mycobacterium ulcerans]